MVPLFINVQETNLSGENTEWNGGNVNLATYQCRVEAVQPIRSKGDIAVMGYEARRVSSADMRFMQFSWKQMIFGTSLIVLIGAGIILWTEMRLTDTLDAQAIRRACRTDIKVYCSAEQPGSDHILACLQQKFSRLSGNCQDVLQAFAPMRVAKS